MKLLGKLPKDDADGVTESEAEARDNFGRGKTIPVIALLGTDDVRRKGNVAVVVIDDIEAVPDEHREHVLELMGAFKSERTGRKTGAQTLDIGDEERVQSSSDADAESPPAEPTPISKGRRK